MKLLIDINLSPEWVEVFASEGLEAVHWSSVGAYSASDKELMAWAKSGGHILLTHDLDFGAILAATNADGPSVVQLRVQDLAPSHAAQPAELSSSHASSPKDSRRTTEIHARPVLFSDGFSPPYALLFSRR